MEGGKLGNITVKEAVQLRRDGLTLKQIAEKAGVSIVATWARLTGIPRAKRAVKIGRLTIEEAIAMRKEGRSQAYIAGKAGVTRQAVHHALLVAPRRRVARSIERKVLAEVREGVRAEVEAALEDRDLLEVEAE